MGSIVNNDHIIYNEGMGGGGGEASWGSITGTLSDQTDLNDELNGKMERVECTYAVDSDLSVLTPLSGDTCLVKSTGKIHTYDGTTWDAGTLGATGAIYIAEGESYIYDTNKFVLLSTENAMTLNGKQDTYFATATELAQKADKTPKVTSIPSDGNYNPNILYVLTLDGTARTISLNSATAGIAAEYHLILTIGATAPTITWPAGLSWVGGSEPTISASKTYEVSICENIAIVTEV